MCTENEFTLNNSAVYQQIIFKKDITCTISFIIDISSFVSNLKSLIFCKVMIL